MKEKRQLKYGTLSNTFFALKWLFKIAPAYTVYQILNTVIGNVITTFEHTFLTAYIIHCIEKQKPITSVLAFLIPVAVAVAIKVIVGPLVTVYVGPKFEAKFKKEVNLTLYEKAVKMEISKYDNSEFYNDFVWAMRQSPSHINGILQDFSQLLSFVVNIIITGSFIIVTDKVTLLIAAVIVPVAFFVPRIINKLVVKREEELVPIRRKRDYVNRVFYLPDFIKDIKTGNMAEKLKKDFKDSSDDMEKPIVTFAKKIIPLQILNHSIADIMVDGVFLVYLFYQVIVLGKYGLGISLGLYNSSNKFINSLYNFSFRFPNFQNHSLYIDKLRTFLDTENEMPDDGTLEVPNGGDIELKDVEFTYNGNEKPTINGISMRIKKGEKIALVGYNGAGKTTLIKLILRLYDPTKGNISFGENNLKEYPLKNYREKLGVLFQDFEIVAANIAQNISMSDEDFDREKADNVLRKVAFSEKFQSLPDGYETQLTKEFSDNGVNLSGGEAQKLALARVLYSSADVIILDEPSSALDPIAEYELNKAVTELSGDKTVIIISHRLSTTRFVDKIYMLESGKIIEQGDHEALLKQNGEYAEMFKAQAEKYVS
jgi:ATP-binding cassette subfamily B protein